MIGLPAVIIGAFSISYIDENIARKAIGCTNFHCILLVVYKRYKSENEKGSKFLYGIFLIIYHWLSQWILSAGTGLLYTLMLTKIYGFSFKEAIGYTLLVVGLFYNLIGAIVLYLISAISITILPVLLIGSLAGGYVGAMIAISRSNIFIKIAYQIVTLIVAYKLLFLD